jgi:cytochrome c553
MLPGSGLLATAFALLMFACSGAAAADSHPRLSPGQRDYATYCAPCHGAGGGGDGPLAPMLATRPARHSDAAFMSALSDEYLLRLLEDGGPAFGKSPLMGAWSRVLSEQRIRDLIAYMRSLPDQAGGARTIADRREGASQQ